MPLTLADLQEWDPEQIDEVAEAAAARARTSREKAQALANLPVLANWDGKGGEAAREALRRSSTKLELSAQDAFRVSVGAGQTYQEALEVKRELAEIFAYAAESPEVWIDTTTNTVEPPDTTYLTPEAAAKVEAKVAELQNRIAVVLANAERTDADLARVVRVATGQESADADKPTPDPRALRPPPGASPKDVNKWWRSRTIAEQNAIKASSPDSIRNLDGIPTDVRSELNMAALPREITRLQNGWLDGTGQVHIDRDKLADLTALQTALHDHPDISLLLLDTTSNPNKVLAAIAKGDVDNAERVSVTVGGMNTSVHDSVEEMAVEATAQHDMAVQLREIANVPNPGSVATIAWLGYEAPGLKDVGAEAMARAGAGPLNHFYHGLAATTNVPDQHITALGHSYGSLTTSLALQQGAPVENVVLYGSPGAEITNASQLGVAPGHAFFEVGMNDGVPDIAQGHRFGPPLQDVPGFTQLSTEPGWALDPPVGDKQWHTGAYGHSEYARPDANGLLRMSGYNMAAVVAGLPGDTVKAPPPIIPPDQRPIIIAGP